MHPLIHLDLLKNHNFYSNLAGCVTLENGEVPILQNICRRLDPKQQIITMFAENYTPINCRSSLEGVFHFSYQVKHRNSFDWNI